MIKKGLVSFFINPKIGIVTYKKPTEKIYTFSLGFLLCVLGLIISGFLHFLIVKYIDGEFDTMNKKTYLINYQNFIKVVIMAPMLEELGFRLPLKPKKEYYIPISFSIITFFSTKLFFDKLNYYVFIICIIVFLISLYKAKSIILLIKKKYFLFFYSMALVFALFHLMAYNTLTQIQVTLFPILILPYFFYALSFSYLRMKLNIFWAISLHFVINLIAFYIKYLIDSPS